MNIFSFICILFMFGTYFGIKTVSIRILLIFVYILFVFLIKCVIFRSNKRGNLCALALIAAFAAGAFLGYSYDKRCFESVSEMYGKRMSVTGTVLELKNNGFVMDAGEYSLMVYNSDPETIPEIDDKITVRGVVNSYPVKRFRGDNDKRLYNALHKIYGKIYAEEIKITGRSESLSPEKAGAAVRTFISSRITESGRYKNVGFIKALLTGDSSGLDEENRGNFKFTGISHLIAVSGLHLGIFMSFFGFITSGLEKHRFAKLSVIFAITLLYIFVVGGRASILRAGIMFVTAAAVTASRHRSDSVMNLMISGTVLCLINPYYMTDAGFQMSFAATLGIVLFAGYFKHKTIAVPVITTLFMTPITVYYYNLFSLSSVLVNIIVVSAVPFIIVFGYLGCFWFPLAGLAEVFATFVLKSAAFFSTAKWAGISLPSTGVYGIIIWLAIVFAAYFIVNKFDIDSALWSLILGILALTFAFHYTAEGSGYTRMNFINMGNFNMIHITDTLKHSVFIDCGYDAASYALKSNVKDISAIIITEDVPSKYGGLEEICKTGIVRKVLLPETMSYKNLSFGDTVVSYYKPGHYNYTFGTTKFKSLKNETENCFLLSANGKTVLIPLDTKSISNYGRCDIVCVPDGCTDCAEYAAVSGARYYIQSTFSCDDYRAGYKYITAQKGLVKFKIFPAGKPAVYTN